MYRILILVALLFSTSFAEYQAKYGAESITQPLLQKSIIASFPEDKAVELLLGKHQIVNSIVSLDYDNDGLMDYIISTQSGENLEVERIYVYENQGTDNGVTVFKDVTVQVLFDQGMPLNWNDCFVADIDNNGFPEILFTFPNYVQVLKYDSTYNKYRDFILDQDSGVVALFENTTFGNWNESLINKVTLLK